MGYNFNYTKSYNDGLDEFMAKSEFIKYFGSESEVVVTSNTAYFDLNVLTKEIDDFFINEKITRKKSYKYYDRNTLKMIDEILYINETNKYTISLIVTGLDNINYESDDENDEEWQEAKENELDRIKNNEIGVFFKGLSFEKTEDKMQKFFDHFIGKGEAKKKKSARELNIIAKNEYGLYLHSFETNEKNVDVALNYNDEFYDISETLIKTLNEKDKNGIALFSGLPGTGKSTYLRYLTQKIKDKKLIYISPDMSSILSEPDFISFMLKHKNSILIIEDAENILKKRSSGGNGALSNLLNVSDGLLGDALKLQIICTFNCKYSDIDEALTRCGRLIAEYRFEQLELTKTNKLLEKIHKGKNFVSKTPLTLAEIYTYDTKQIKSKEQENKIGFSR